MTIQQPRLVVGRGGGVPAMLTVGSGYTDDSVAYDLLASTDRLAPAGVSGECAFYFLYVAIEHDVAIPVLRVTPIVDGVALRRATTTSRSRPRVTSRSWRSRSRAVPEHDAELPQPRPVRAAWNLDRGKVETVGGLAGYAALHGCEVEHEVVREALREGANK
jgi:hypothetical protein